MIQFLIWFLGVVLCGLGISVFIGGLSMHKEAISSLFDKELLEVFIFSFVGFFFDGVGIILFYLGYYVMEHNI